MRFARRAHKHQMRKYINVPYFSHLCEVVGLVSTVTANPSTLSIAWLHDCIEDCEIQFEALKEIFNLEIAEGVLALSDLEIGNRKFRKIEQRKRLHDTKYYIQNIKVCDIISNTPSILHYDPKFSPLYIEETQALLEILTEADKTLLRMASNMVNKNV